MKQLNENTRTRKCQLYNPNNQPKLIFFMIGRLFLFSIIFLQTNAFAQRGFGVCDSTSYTLNIDTTIIAGRNHLYLHTNNTTNILYDFTTLDSNEYIRDFDIIKPDLWYTVVGSRYIGYSSSLYKSINRGLSWTLDTNHYNAANAQSLSPQFLTSINNLQHLNGDTLLMFMYYYESGIIYSTDLGQTWTKWFDNLIAHYQGMFECNNKYYIFGYEGDAFPASMFGFEKNLLFTTDSTGLWSHFNSIYHPPCYNGADTVNCIFAQNNLTRCDAYTFFKDKIDSICTPLSVNILDKNILRIYPNPFISKINIEGSLGTEMYLLKNLYGQTVWTGKHIEQQHFYHLCNGIYFLTIVKETMHQTLKLIKE